MCMCLCICVVTVSIRPKMCVGLYPLEPRFCRKKKWFLVLFFPSFPPEIICPCPVHVCAHMLMSLQPSRLFAYHVIHVREHHCYHITNICTSSNEPCLSTTKTIIIAFLTSDKKHTNRMLVKPLWLLFNFLRPDPFNNAER